MGFCYLIELFWDVVTDVSCNLRSSIFCFSQRVHVGGFQSEKRVLKALDVTSEFKDN
jgi:hypothetical protein